MNRKRKIRKWAKMPGSRAQEVRLQRGRNFKSGETLVEVMVSVVIFLLLVALLEGSVSFCTSAQKKSREIRENTSTAIETYWDGNTSLVTFTAGETPTTLNFSAFSVKVTFDSSSVSYKDTDNNTQSTTFYTFGNGVTTSGGTGENGETSTTTPSETNE